MTNTTDEEVELSYYYNILRKNWLLALIIFLIVMGAAIAYTLTAPKIYEAKSLVLVTSQDQTSYLLEGSIATIPTAGVDIETQKEIITSSSVLNPVYEEFGTTGYKVSVDSAAGSSVLEIKVDSQNVLAAMRIANKIAESYVNYTTESKKQDAMDVNNFIAEELALYKQELDVLNHQILAYGNATNVSKLIGEKLFTYQSLQQSLDAKQKLYNYLLSRAEEVSIVAKEKSGNIKIVEPATIPKHPISPIVPLYLAIGFILAIIISSAAVFIKENLKDTFKSLKEVEDSLGHIIGVIPQIKRGEYSSERKVMRFIKNPSFHRVKGAGGENKEYFLVDPESEGPFAESIRMLKTRVLFSIKEKNIKLISVNSPQKNDGKTLMVLNLGLELAQEGKKVLLIDANIRNPLLDKVLLGEDAKGKSSSAEEESKEGLTDVILGEAKLEKAIRKTEYKNLYLLPAGKSYNQMPSELLSGDKVKELFTRLKATNLDAIIFDNTSLKYSESLVIAAHSQGVLFVIAHDKTNKELALKAKASLNKVKASLLGCIVNFFR